MNRSGILAFILLLVGLGLPACSRSPGKPRRPVPKVTTVTVEAKAVTLTDQYVGQLRPHHQIEVKAPAAGMLAAPQVREGQTVERDDVLFEIRPVGSRAAAEGDQHAEQIAVRARLEGVVGPVAHSEGETVKQGEVLTTLSDQDPMWAYFNVPEARYLQYAAADLEHHRDEVNVELVLANGQKYDLPGKLGAIAAVFDSRTGTIPFRADFPNPDHVLRAGRAATVQIGRVVPEAIVIPQRATFEVLDNRYVFVIGADQVAHSREIVIQSEVDNQFVVKAGLHVGDKIVLEGMRQVQDGDRVEFRER